MNFGELQRFLSDQIDRLKQVQSENEASKKRYVAALDQLKTMDDMNRSCVVASVLGDAGKTKASILDYFLGLPDDLKRDLAVIFDGFEAQQQRLVSVQASAGDRLDVSVLSRNLNIAKAAYKKADTEYQHFEAIHRIFRSLEYRHLKWKAEAF